MVLDEYQSPGMIYPPYPYKHYCDYPHTSWSPSASMQNTLAKIMSAHNEMKTLITNLSSCVTEIENTLSQSSNSTESKRVCPSLSVSIMYCFVHLVMCVFVQKLIINEQMHDGLDEDM